MVFDQHSDKIVTHIADLGDRAEWVCEFTDQADAHPELVTAHRPSYLAWHCRGRSVLDIRRTKPGLGIRAGVVSSKPGDTPFSPGVELDIGGPLKNSEHASLVRGVEVAVAERLDGTDHNPRGAPVPGPARSQRDRLPALTLGAASGVPGLSAWRGQAATQLHRLLGPLR